MPKPQTQGEANFDCPNDCVSHDQNYFHWQYFTRRNLDIDVYKVNRDIH